MDSVLSCRNLMKEAGLLGMFRGSICTLCGAFEGNCFAVGAVYLPVGYFVFSAKSVMIKSFDHHISSK